MNTINADFEFSSIPWSFLKDGRKATDEFSYFHVVEEFFIIKKKKKKISFMFFVLPKVFIFRQWNFFECLIIIKTCNRVITCFLFPSYNYLIIGIRKTWEFRLNNDRKRNEKWNADVIFSTETNSSNKKKTFNK